MNKYDKACVAIVVVGLLIIAGQYWHQRLAPEQVQPEPQVTTSVLVGTGCEGLSSIAVAYEEDAMPLCASIERHWLNG